MIVLDGRSLTPVAVVRAARTAAPFEIAPDALARVGDVHREALAARARGPVYGATTGVGANRTVAVDAADRAGHGLRMLRSHAAGVGPVEAADVTRAAMAVRLNQLLAGGSGIDPDIVTALGDALRDGSRPILHRYGAIGTGDLSALGELGLTLAGERPWAQGRTPPVAFGPGDALALMSSNALTVATAVLAWSDLDQLVRASAVVGALTFIALRGSPEAYAATVHDARPHPGQVAVAATMRRLIGSDTAAAARLQDPFALRTLPQVNGVALDAAERLHGVLTREINGAAENPMVADGSVLHHGSFHTAELAAALDGLRAALVPLASLSSARLGALIEPSLSELTPFLAFGPAGSSGVMTLEYVALDAVAELRARAVPAAIGGAVISRGAEEHASFSTQAARRTAELVEPLGVVLACELVAAVRALRMAPERLRDAPVRAAFDAAASVLDADPADRSLGADLVAAIELLPRLAER